MVDDAVDTVGAGDAGGGQAAVVVRLIIGDRGVKDLGRLREHRSGQ